jgi:hypothetical protein
MPVCGEPGLHGGDSYVAPNVLHARDQHVSSVQQAYRPQNVSDYFHGFHFAPFLKINLCNQGFDATSPAKVVGSGQDRSQYIPGSEVQYRYG